MTTTQHRLITLSLALLATAAGAARAQTTQPVTLPRSQQFDLAAPNGQVYRIFVAEPETPAPASGYATYIALDGNAMFGTVVDAVRLQKGIVPTLVVGVGYPTDAAIDIQRRYYDFSPVTPPELMWESGSEPRAKPARTGGEDEFLDFLEQTLKPELAKRYKLDTTRQTLFGHSLAGRFVLHALFTRPASFSHYVACSPSIWWNDKSVLREADAYQAKANTLGLPPRSLLITAAGLEERPASGTSPERARFFAMAKMVSNARALAESLQPLKRGALETTFIEYPEENHGSTVPFTISRSIRFALSAPPKPATQATR